MREIRIARMKTARAALPRRAAKAIGIACVALAVTGLGAAAGAETTAPVHHYHHHHHHHRFHPVHDASELIHHATGTKPVRPKPVVN
jgi:isopropylmalate/homocitrate/citramalate synthase